MAKKVALFLAPGYEEVEAITPADILTRAGIEVHLVAVSDQKLVRSANGFEINCHYLLDQVELADYQMLILPGGLPGTDNLAASDKLTAGIKAFAQADKPLAAICAAPSVYARLGLLNGRKATSYPGFDQVMKENGVEYQLDRVVCDGNFITSRGPATAADFAFQIVRYLVGDEIADQVASGMLYQ